MVNQELQDYVGQQLATGVAKDVIKGTLLSKGWVEQDVNEALSILQATKVVPVSIFQSSNPIPAVNQSTETFSDGKFTTHPRTGVIAFIILVVCLIIAGTGYYFFPRNTTPKADIAPSASSVAVLPPLPTAGTTTAVTVQSNYGFSFTLPVGWHIWEGQSASISLMGLTDFVSIMNEIVESGNMSDENAKKVLGYQEFMNNWDVSSSTFISLTSANLAYKNRDLATAGKYASIPIDSTDILRQGETGILISGAPVDFAKASVKTATREEGNISISGTEARYVIARDYKFVDLILVKYPIVSNKFLNGKTVQSLVFNRYVQKNDPEALQNLVSFISELNITKNP